MLITNRERMIQLSSALNSSITILKNAMSDRKLLDVPVASCTNITIGELLDRMSEMTHTIGGSSKDAPKYWADVDLPYTEDTFPVEH